MPIRLHDQGACLPTRLESGNLIITVGYDEVSVPFKFLTEDYPYDNRYFTKDCNIMLYLENENSKFVMRKDGSITKYTADDIVIAFHEIDPNIFKDYISVLELGCYNKVSDIEMGRTGVPTLSTWVVLPKGSQNAIIEFLLTDSYVKLHFEDNPYYLEELKLNLPLCPWLAVYAKSVKTKDHPDLASNLQTVDGAYSITCENCTPSLPIIL